MTRPLSRLVLTLLLMFLATKVAYANDPATRAAKRFYDRGEKLFALGKFDQALEEYQKAYDAKPLPDFLFNIGQCYRNLGDYDAAIFSFKKFLKLEPEADNREQVEEYISDLEKEQERDNSQRLGLVSKKKKQPKQTEQDEAENAPVYKKWWFWTTVAVVGAGAGVGIYAATRSSGPPMTDAGNINFPP